MNESIYNGESMARVVPFLREQLGAGFEAGTDALNIFHGTVTALAAGGDVRTNAAAKVYAVHISSPSASTTDVVVRLFNTSTGGIALTTTAYGTCAEAIAVKCVQTKSRTAVFLPNGTEFGSALSYAVVSASALDTAAAAGAAPTVTILYS
jgi:hypothetical protein